MSSRQASKSREMSHYIVAIAAVLTAVALRLIGHATQLTSITGWGLTAALVVGVVLFYAFNMKKSRASRGRQLPLPLEPPVLFCSCTVTVALAVLSPSLMV